MMTT